MNDLVALTDARCEVLFLEPAVGDTVKLSWPRAGESFALYFTLPGRVAAARRHDAHDRRRAPALSPRPPAAARDPRIARGGRRSLRLHAARLPPDLPAVSPGHRRRTLLRGARCCRAAPRASPSGPASGASTSRPGAARSAACCAAQAASSRLRTTWRRACSGYYPELAIEIWTHPEAPAAPMPASCAWRSSATCRRRKACTSSLPARATRATADCRSCSAILGSTTEPILQAPDAPLTIYGQYVDSDLPQADRRGEARRAAVRGAGARDLCVHAVGGAAVRTADRGVGTGRVSRAACRRRPRSRPSPGTRRRPIGTTHCSRRPAWWSAVSPEWPARWPGRQR